MVATQYLARRTYAASIAGALIHALSRRTSLFSATRSPFLACSTERRIQNFVMSIWLKRVEQAQLLDPDK